MARNVPDEAAIERLLKTNKQLLISGDYSDFTLSCGGRLYRLHKSIVCPHSSFFTKVLASPMKEKTNHVNLPESDPLVVYCMIRYFYDLNYHAESQDETIGFENQGAATGKLIPHHGMKLHGEVYILAHLYEIDGLKTLALKKFNNAWRQEFDRDAFFSIAEAAYKLDGESEKNAGLQKSIVDALITHREEIFVGDWELQDFGRLFFDYALWTAGRG